MSAEPYSDDELVDVLSRIEAPSAGFIGRTEAKRLAPAVRRLQRERDEARRVARVLVMENRPGAVKHHTSSEWVDAVKTALAYPEVPHG